MFRVASKHLVSSVALLCLLGYHTGLSTTNCQQSFSFFGFTRAISYQPGLGTFWIGEDIGGECHASRLIQVSVTPEGVTDLWTPSYEYGEWDWLREGMGYLQREDPEELVERAGLWYCRADSFTLASPVADSASLSLVRDAFAAGSSELWNKVHELGISLPVFEGATADLIYHHRGGVYVGYDFSHIYYLPRFKYLVAFIHQPLLVSGLDTRHGFMIFRMTK